MAPKRGSEGYGGMGTTRAQSWGWSPYADFTKHSPRVIGLVSMKDSIVGEQLRRLGSHEFHRQVYSS